MKRPNAPPEERFQVHARLNHGEMLHITFSDEADDPGDLHIEGPGEIRLAIRPRREFKAEVVRGSCLADADPSV